MEVKCDDRIVLHHINKQKSEETLPVARQNPRCPSKPSGLAYLATKQTAIILTQATKLSIYNFHDHSNMSAQPTIPNPRSHFLGHISLGHISLGIRSYAVSKTYYNPLFAPFGISLVYSSDVAGAGILGFGPDTSPENELFTLFEKGEGARVPGPGTHLAFNAPSRKAVREFWEAGVRNGGGDEGPPGVRVEVGERYYAAFVRDPDGYKLEAVYQGENDEV